MPNIWISFQVRSIGVQQALDVAIGLMYIGAAYSIYKIQKRVKGSVNHEKAKARQNYRIELRLLLIAGIATIPQVICVALNQVIYYVPMVPDVSSWVGYITTMLSLIVHGVSPYVYIGFSREFRIKIMEMYLKDSDQVTAAIKGNMQCQGSGLAQPSIKVNRFLTSQSKKEVPDDIPYMGGDPETPSKSRMQRRRHSEFKP